MASGLSAKDDEAQVNTLIYAMGDEADNILRSFSLSAEDRKKYDVVKGKYDNHFDQWRNVIFERARFNMRRQEESESVDTFITALYALAEHCGYGNLHDEMIRDRIVVGIRNRGLSEKLQLDSKLTLETAVSQVRQAEAVKLQQSLLRGSCTDTRYPCRRSSKGKGRMQGEARTVEPQTAILRVVKGVANFLPVTELAALLRMPSVENVTREGTSRLYADQQPRWQASGLQDSPATPLMMPSLELWSVHIQDMIPGP